MPPSPLGRDALYFRVMAPADPNDRHAYLEEQIAKQKRGEPIDVEWVRSELERIRREQATRMADTQRHLRWLVTGAAVLMLVLWYQNGGLTTPGGLLALGLALVGLVMAFRLRK
jgi:hypothetical protein